MAVCLDQDFVFKCSVLIPTNNSPSFNTGNITAEVFLVVLSYLDLILPFCCVIFLVSFSFDWQGSTGTRDSVLRHLHLASLTKVSFSKKIVNITMISSVWHFKPSFNNWPKCFDSCRLVIGLSTISVKQGYLLPASHRQQFFSELPSPWRSHKTNYRGNFITLNSGLSTSLLEGWLGIEESLKINKQTNKQDNHYNDGNLGTLWMSQCTSHIAR